VGMLPVDIKSSNPLPPILPTSTPWTNGRAKSSDPSRRRVCHGTLGESTVLLRLLMHMRLQSLALLVRPDRMIREDVSWMEDIERDGGEGAHSAICISEAALTGEVGLKRVSLTPNPK
jgi:hypothetical protein